MSAAVILTYHAIGDGAGPLFVDEGTFAAQLDCIVRSGARVLTVSALARELGDGGTDGPTVAITFDDGAASVAHVAAPLLAAPGLTATVFCVAGHLGGTSEWPSAPRGAGRLPLLGADDLRALAAQGVEVGSHGMEHEPLVGSSRQLLQREVVESRVVLEDQLGVEVRAFAYPYGAGPSPAAQSLVAKTYRAACTTKMHSVADNTDPLALPRIDVHYVRSAQLFRKTIEGSLDLYLRARGLGARARRTLFKDYQVARAGLS